MSSWRAEMQRFAPHSMRLQASQSWLSPMTCSTRASCVLSPSPVATPPASQFLPRSSTASGRRFSLRRCRESAVSRCLRMPTSARRLAFGRSKRPHAHAASSFQSTRLHIARKLGAPSTRRKQQVRKALTCWRRRLSSTVAHFDRARALRLPAVYQWPQMAEEGGLIGYGPLIVPLWRDAMSRQLAKLLRGAQPGDLPVEQPTRFELVINLKTAKAIGHDVPGALVVRADKVIE